MQADRRLVEDVQHADERRPDLRREPDALRFAARERRRGPREIEIAEPDVREEAEPCAHFLENLRRDQFFTRRGREVLEECFRFFDGHRRDGRDVLAVDGHGQRLRLQTRALARFARRRRHELFDLFFDVVRRRVAVPPLQVVDDAFELRFVGPRVPALRLVRELLFPVRAVEDRLDEIRRHLVDGRRHLDAPRPHQLLDLLHVVRVHRRILAAAERLRPRDDRAAFDRFRPVRHHLPRVDLDLHAETRTVRTRAVRRVEREESRRELLEREPAIHARERFRERELARRRALALRDDRDDTAREPQRRLDRIGQALADVGLHHEPVDDDLDRVLLLLVEVDLLAQFDRLAVHADAREALLADLLEELRVLALAAANDGREQLDARAFRQLHHLVDDLLARLRADLASAVVAMRVTDAREEQPQVVVDLGDRADRRARIARGRLLIDRDRGREALDVIDVRLLHLAEELARVARERLDVPPLALRIDRIERERRFPRAR